MAAEVVGGALLSGFLNALFDRMATKDIVNLFRGKKVIAERLAELKIRLLSANSLLNDAEEKQFRDKNVRKWIEELKDVIYRADNVMDKVNTEALRHELEEVGESGSKGSECMNCIPTFFRTSKFEYTVKAKIEEILHTLDLLLKQRDDLGLREGVGLNRPSQRLLCPLVVEESDVYGREADKEAIIKFLFSNGSCRDKISVISIAGMGGIGKTTLAQLVYNDNKVKDQFALKAWVTVSEEFDVPNLTRKIIEIITSKKCDIEEQYQLQDKLKEELMGKRFLFVLDDVWNESYQLWEILKSPFESGAHDSKIIVTTRSRTVASIMGKIPIYELGMMSEEDCLKLFKRHVFDNVETEILPDLQETISEIVKKCKGLPLAIKAVAGLLRSIPNQEEWGKLLQNDVWELQFQENRKNNIPPALWFSYHSLPQQLKRCFAYCSIFPKDYEFTEDDQEKLILLWMAEGFLQLEKGKTMEDVGEEYLKALVSRSFFQQLSRNGKSILIMHDLVHDLAIRVSGEFYCIHDGSNYLHDSKSKIHHLSYLKSSKDKMILESLPEAQCLRTFLALPMSVVYYRRSILAEKIQQELLLSARGCLRVLSSFQPSIKKLPDSIGNLKHLRYLDLSHTDLKELPGSVCTLYNLQTLLLSSCKKLEQLPTDICSLINLRHLVIKDTAIKEMPPQMCKLTNLQTLSDFVLGENSGSRIKELRALQHLHGSLCISGLENVKDIGDALGANLKKKEHLTELVLIWKHYETDKTSKVGEVLNALEPHRKLKKLEIQGCRGITFPDWVASKSFVDMVEVRLEDCQNCCLLSPFGQLSSLRRLAIDGIYMKNECFEASLTKPFPFLEGLFMKNFVLEKWPTAANQEAGLSPRLNHIRLWRCSKLNVGLPACCLPSLKTIEIWQCHEMVSVFPASQEIDIAYPSLESLRILDGEKLESFSEMGLPSNLKELSVYDCEKLTANRMNWNLQRLSNLQTLWLLECEELLGNSFPEEGLFPSSLTSLNIWYFRKLKGLNGKGFQHLTSLQVLDIRVCEELECLPEEGLPLSLSMLRIVECPLLSRRCERETGKDWPKIQHIPTTCVD